MGQPKFPRKKYETPNHPWQGDRIKEEHELRKKFGLKNKTEIWKAQSKLRTIRSQARELISRGRNPDDAQAQLESKRLLNRLHREGYVGPDASLGEVLGLDVERILNRRLQSQVYLKGMARTPKQARQFVSHGLIQIGERRVDVPSYVVRRDEEEIIQFVESAAVANPDHPVRPKAPGQEVIEAVEETKETPEIKATPSEAPAEAPTKETPAEETKEAPTEETKETPAEETKETPTEDAKEAPAEETAEASEEPAKETAEEPAPADDKEAS